MRILIVDDEAPARRRLRRMLEKLEDVDVVGEAEHGRAALERLACTEVDLVMLDIEMPGMDGLALASRGSLPLVVFVTAHSEHAAHAFDLYAVDYLVKPVSAARVVEALARARARMTAAVPSAPRVVVRRAHDVRLFDVAQITRFRASEKYTAFVCNGTEELTEEPLSALEARLASHGYVRVHRGELVRLDAIRALETDTDGASATMEDGQTARVSRRALPELRRMLLALTRG